MGHQDIEPYWPNYIDGGYCHGRGGRIDINDPSSGTRLAEHALADAHDIDRAIQAAKDTHLSGVFSDLHPVERGRMVIKMGEYLDNHFDDIVRILTLEQGKPLFEAQDELKLALRFFEYFGSMAEALEGRSVPNDNATFDLTRYRSFGVSAHFLPCHYPIYIPARSLVPALVAGNCCVLKTSELAPISATWFARAADAAGLPKGVVNILCGRGEEAGVALASHPDIDHLVFIGRPEIASKVLANVAVNSRVPSILEVAGTSPTLVFEDADLDVFIPAARTGSYWNAGQFCSGMYRVIVHESKYQELLDRAVALAESLEVGPGIESGAFGPYMGPLDSDAQLERVVARVEDSIRAGAKCMVGGCRIQKPGSFMAPTVLCDVVPGMRVAQEEVFGPVMAVMKFRSENEAFDIANGARQSGMTCAVFTKDFNRMMRAAHTVRAGHIMANNYSLGGAEVPFGGTGRAGYGLLKGRDALLGYVQTKNILLKTT